MGNKNDSGIMLPFNDGCWLPVLVFNDHSRCLTRTWRRSLR